MDNIEHRKSNMKWLSEGSNHQVFVKHEILDMEIFDNSTAILLFEDCMVDIYKIIEKLKLKIKTLEAKITVLEQSNKDDNSTLIN